MEQGEERAEIDHLPIHEGFRSNCFLLVTALSQIQGMNLCSAPHLGYTMHRKDASQASGGDWEGGII